jgi:hypothetical protein
LTLQIVAGSQVLRDVVLVTDDAEVGVRRGPRDARVDGLPGVRLDVSEWEAFATGALEPAALVAGLPAWSRRGAQTALRGVVALLAGSPLPPPPAP